MSDEASEEAIEILIEETDVIFKEGPLTIMGIPTSLRIIQDGAYVDEVVSGTSFTAEIGIGADYSGIDTTGYSYVWLEVRDHASGAAVGNPIPAQPIGNAPFVEVNNLSITLPAQAAQSVKEHRVVAFCQNTGGSVRSKIHAGFKLRVKR